MIDVVNYLRGLADNIENGNIIVERFDLSDELIPSSNDVQSKNKYVKTGTSELNLTLKK